MKKKCQVFSSSLLTLCIHSISDEQTLLQTETTIHCVRIGIMSFIHTSQTQTQDCSPFLRFFHTFYWLSSIRHLSIHSLCHIEIAPLCWPLPLYTQTNFTEGVPRTVLWLVPFWCNARKSFETLLIFPFFVLLHTKCTLFGSLSVLSRIVCHWLWLNSNWKCMICTLLKSARGWGVYD